MEPLKLPHCDRFLAKLAREDLAAHTRLNYRLDPLHFARWFNGSTGEACSPNSVTPTDGREYHSFLPWWPPGASKDAGCGLPCRCQRGDTSRNRAPLAPRRTVAGWATMPTPSERNRMESNPLPPSLELDRLITGMYVTQALAVVAKLGVADLLADAPQTVEQLAIATDTHAPSLYRVLRMLASLGVFAEGEQGQFG